MDVKNRGITEDFEDCSMKKPRLLECCATKKGGAAGHETTLEGVIRTSAASFSILSRTVRKVDWARPLSSLAFSSFSYLELNLSGP